MLYIFGKNKSANSIIYSVLIIFTGFFITSCFPDSDENNFDLIRKPAVRGKTENGKNIFTDVLNSVLYKTSVNENTFWAGKYKTNGNYGNLPIRFENNLGQFDKRVKLASHGTGYNFFITQSENVLVLNKVERNNESESNQQITSKENTIVTQKSIIRMQFESANKKNLISGIETLPGKSSYFIGKDISKWQTDISQYAKAKQEGIYPGIDVLYYGSQNKLEYDFLINPNGDPRNIVFKLKGAKKNYVDDDGNLILQTEIGDIKLTKPIAYQLIGGQKTIIDCKYIVTDENKVSFKVGSYDKSELLTIDPVIDYSTFLGGTGTDSIKDMAVDSSGNVYLTGQTSSTNFPTTSGVYRTTNAGSADAFVLKLDSTGSNIIYSTYLGGTGSESGNSLTIDSSGNAYIAGQTSNNNFPVLNARQPTYGGGDNDCFITKLSSTGNSLVYSTNHGGNNTDICYGIALDSTNNVYVTGSTVSANFPIANAFQSTITPLTNNSGPSGDVFISKLNAAGNTLVYSTFLGGSESETGRGIAVDNSGNAYISGYTNSYNFDIANAYQPVRQGFWLDFDAFVTKLSVSGNTLVYSTYLGGNQPDSTPCFPGCLYSATDYAYDITVDSQGFAYVVGSTTATNFPVVNAYQSFNRSDLNYTGDAYLTKVNQAGNALVFSTYLGGNNRDEARGVALDDSGNVYVTGITTSTNFPQVNSIQQINSGSEDVFLTRFNSNGQSLSFSSYIGGSGNDNGSSVSADSSGNIYVAGSTFSTNFPTAFPVQSTNQGDSEGFVMKILPLNGYNITGQITKPDGTSAGNVTVVLSSGQNKTTTTDANGNYSFVNLSPNRQYVVTPVSGTFTFLPASQTFTSLTSDVIANFVIETYDISGHITDNGGGVSQVTVNLSGDQSRTTLTNTDGYYLFTNLPGGNYTVTPSKTDPVLTYTFTPPSQSFTGILSSKTADFVANATTVTEVVPVADAYVQDGTSAAVNFGAVSNLKVETDSKTNNGKNFDTYLKFDLSGINGGILNAKLRFYASSSTSGSVSTSAYSVSSINWVESGASGITWNNKPARSVSPLTGASVSIAGTAFTTYDIDVTNYLKSEKAAGRNTISLALHNSSASTVFVTANSRESSSNKPRLVITADGNPNIAPVISMTAPANNTTFNAPANIAVSAAASDADGTISRVDFYNGTTLIGTSTAPVSGSTYSINWTNVAAGNYVLTAIAYDDKGAQTIAVPVNIAVNAANNLPTVSITGPANNSTFAVGSNINLTATATDADGDITKVEFFAGSTLVGTATTTSSGNNYAVTWSNAATGSYALTAKATDNSGGVTTSSSVNVNIVGQIGLSPTADAYVQDGSSATTNFGTATELRTQVSATSGSNRETYLKYDLTAATGITKAVLRLYGRLSDTSGTNVAISIYPVSTTTWVESGSGSLTWNNKPAAGATVLASATVTDNTSRWYEFDITSYIQTEKAAGRNTISFAVKGNSASSPHVTFNSREAATNQPQLIMQTTQPRDVLLVVGSTNLNTGDNAVKTRLQNLGFTVTVKAAGSTTNTSVKATDADGKALVLVSSTVTPANVGTKLKNIPVPVLNWEFDLADDFGMTNTVSGTDFGTTASQTQAAIVASSHPMSAGLTGTQTLVSASSTFSWGKPNANSVKIASLTTDSTKLVIYGYDAGKAMFGLESPARRVAVYLSDTTAASLTTNGGLLFDAAVKWTCEIPISSPSITSLSPSSGSVGTAVTISGTNFGSSQGTSTVTFNGITASISSWSSTSIGTIVPAGAATGNIVVTVSGIASNGMPFTVTNPNGDSDGDGIPDWWEMQYFGTLSYGANDDPDGDGITNLQEYLQGRNPTTGTVSSPGAVDLRVFTPLEP